MSRQRELSSSSATLYPMIPYNITKEHLLKTMEEIDRTEVPEDRLATKYHVVFDGKRYPPIYIISIANRYANGKELEPTMFSRGDDDEANPFFKARDFEVILVDDSEKAYDDKIKESLALIKLVEDKLENKDSIHMSERIQLR